MTKLWCVCGVVSHGMLGCRFSHQINYQTTEAQSASTFEHSAKGRVRLF